MRLKDFLFKPTQFKQLISDLTVIPMFMTGFCVMQLSRTNPLISHYICWPIVTVGVLWAIWSVMYVHEKQKRP